MKKRNKRKIPIIIFAVTMIAVISFGITNAIMNPTTSAYLPKLKKQVPSIVQIVSDNEDLFETVYSMQNKAKDRNIEFSLGGYDPYSVRRVNLERRELIGDISLIRCDFLDDTEQKALMELLKLLGKNGYIRIAPNYVCIDYNNGHISNRSPGTSLSICTEGWVTADIKECYYDEQINDKWYAKIYFIPLD